MVHSYIILAIFCIGLICTIFDIFKAKKSSKDIKSLYIENRVLFVVIYLYVIFDCIQKIMGI